MWLGERLPSFAKINGWRLVTDASLSYFVAGKSNRIFHRECAPNLSASEPRARKKWREPSKTGPGYWYWTEVGPGRLEDSASYGIQRLAAMRLHGRQVAALRRCDGRHSTAIYRPSCGKKADSNSSWARPVRATTAMAGVHVRSVWPSVMPLMRLKIQKPLSFIQEIESPP